MTCQKMNLLMAVNEKYVPQLRTLICSLGENCSLPIDIYLMHSKLCSDTIKNLKKIVHEKCKGNLVEIKINESFLKNAKLGNHFSVEMYYRIFASEYLPENIDRILWLDADIVVLKDLKYFYNSNLHNKSIGACKHREKDVLNPIVNQESIKRLGMDTNSIYFNSGVLLIDLNKIRKNFNQEKVISLIRKYNDILVYPDQDILNLMYVNDVHFVDESIFNYQVHYDWNYIGEAKHIKNDVAILHFAGPFKPWDYKSNHFSYDYYWKYYLVHGKRSVYLKYLILKKIYTIYMALKLRQKGDI